MKTTQAVTILLSALLAVSTLAEPLTLLESGNTLRFIDTTVPAAALRTVAITGLQNGEAVIAIDYRPATRELYGVGVVPGGISRLYKINTTTGAATLIGGGPFDSVVGQSTNGLLGMDFNPVVDRIRLINSIGMNMRIHPDTATVVVDTDIFMASGEVTQGNAKPIAIAYTNNVAGALTATLYGVISANGPVVVRICSTGGTPISPNAGTMFIVGPTGARIYSSLHQGLDVSRSGIAYMIVDNTNTLYTVNLTTGTATALGSLPPSTTQGPLDLAAPGPTPKRRSVRK